MALVSSTSSRMPNSSGQVCCSGTLIGAALADTHFRARRHSQNPRKCSIISPRCYVKALDGFLRLVSRCVANPCPCPLCWAYPWHLAEQYLQSPLQLEHACGFIFDSELFAFHSERMCEILTDEATMVRCVLRHSCVFSELMSSQSEHRSSRSVHAVQRFTLLWSTQPELPSLTQAMAAVNSLAHGSRSR